MALDGATGVDTRWALPRGHVRRWVDGVKDVDVDDWPSASGPIVRDDGAVVVVTSRTFAEGWWLSESGPPPMIYPDPDRPGWATTDIHLAILPEGSAGPALIPLVEHSTTDGLNGAAYRLLPDGAGGLLVAHRATAAVRRIDAPGTLGPHVPLLPAGIYTATYETEYVLGETEAYALVKGQGGSGPRADVIPFDPITLEPGLPALVVGAPHVQLRYAAADGGVHVSGPTVGVFGSDVHLWRGIWGAWQNAPLTYTGGVRAASVTGWSFSHGTASAQNREPAICGACYTGYQPPQGHGPVSTNDPRRVLTIAIDSSWDSSPGQTNQRIWNAAHCAASMWNNAVDEWGNSTGYYFIFDQVLAHGPPDVKIIREGCQAGAGWACTSIANSNWFWVPSEMKVASKNIEMPTVRDQDLCGRIAHELAHKIGGATYGICRFSILRGTHDPDTGIRLDGNNRVWGHDVALVNRALRASETCTADPFDPWATSEP